MEKTIERNYNDGKLAGVIIAKRTVKVIREGGEKRTLDGVEYTTTVKVRTLDTTEWEMRLTLNGAPVKDYSDAGKPLVVGGFERGRGYAVFRIGKLVGKMDLKKFDALFRETKAELNAISSDEFLSEEDREAFARCEARDAASAAFERDREKLNNYMYRSQF